jgi:phage-related minor tail protein
MGEVTTAVEDVISSIDGMASASNAELQAVTASVLDIATAFEVDVSDAARTAGILLKTGLAGDATEAADLITRSLQSVPASLRGEILEATQEYGQFFDAVGLDGPQALKLLTDGAENGQIGIDKMGDAIKEFTIRATDMSTASVDAFDAIGLDAQKMANDLLAGGDTARDAFDTIVDGLQGIEDPADRANAAIALFGTPLEDIGVRDIPQFLAGLQDLDGGLSDVSGAAAAMGDTLNDNVATRLEALKRGAETLLTDGIGALFAGFDQAAVVAVRFAQAFGGAAAAFEPVRVALVELATEAGTRLGPVFADVGARIQNDLLPALNEFATAMAPIVEFIVTNVGPQIVGVFEAVGTVLGGLVDIVAGVFSTIAAVIQGDWSGAWDGVLKILGGAVKVVKGALSALLNVFGLSFSRIGTIASQTWGNIRRFFSDGASNALRTVRNLGSSVLNAFDTLRSRAVYAIGFLWGRVTSLFNSGTSRMATAAGVGVGRVLAFFQGLPGQIGQAIGNLGGLLYDAGQNVVQGLIDGIASMISGLAGAASSLAKTIRDYLPFSPAKVGPLSGSGSPDNSGEVIARMIADGIQQNVNLPARAMERALAPLGSAAVRSRPQVSARAAGAVPAGVSVTNNLYGPTTGSDVLRESTWSARFAPRTSRFEGPNLRGVRV